MRSRDAPRPRPPWMTICGEIDRGSGRSGTVMCRTSSRGLESTARRRPAGVLFCGVSVLSVAWRGVSGDASCRAGVPRLRRGRRPCLGAARDTIRATLVLGVHARRDSVSKNGQSLTDLFHCAPVRLCLPPCHLKCITGAKNRDTKTIYYLQRDLRFLRGQQTEALFAYQALLREFVVGGEAGGVRRFRGLAIRCLLLKSIASDSTEHVSLRTGSAGTSSSEAGGRRTLSV